ncbi:MAG: DUF6893 family small protein [Streptosporangiaceae bacterium]
MFRRLIIGAFAVGVAALVVQSLPDVVRYLKIREM